MKITFSEEGFQDYLYWQAQDKKTLRRINQLIADISRNGIKGIGKSEKLKHTKGYSRRIDGVNRLVFDIEGGNLNIVSCRFHYER